MRRILSILLCAMGLTAYAADYTPFAATTPSAAMQSVNAGYLSSGSSYSSLVYEVGSYSPSAAPAAGPRKAPPPTGGESGYDPSNPQFAPLGNAVLPLLLMGLAFIAYIALRRKQIINHQS